MIAIFAGGCFWCMESIFDSLAGVKKVLSGYTGGHIKNPSYEQVSMGDTGHYEALKIIFNPQKISYDQLLDVYWYNIDPFDGKGQFGDKGPSYLSAIFYLDKLQKVKAEFSKKNIEKILERSVVTTIIKASVFYPAEQHHQQYYKRNPVRYQAYNYERTQRLLGIWGQEDKYVIQK
ncbi:MAG: peptide-methionine (S)-S-oxide reductase MsrA [Alphaproteobacteria bacterium]|nr:peptide-methionine (S)-S-oxide reductase MsrA [Alphaproteobacteria bacterium]